MVGFLNLLDFNLYLRQPWLLVVLGFQLWMLVDAIRRNEWLWALFIFIFPVLNAILYFFLVYRAQPRVAFELPGTHRRKRIRDLEAQIHHLDKAHHHAELADIYLQEGRLKEAEQSYRAAIQRDGSDPDYRAHLGQCLLRQGRLTEALPLLEEVARYNSNHDYGQTLMAYAEGLQKLGRHEEALAQWQRVLEAHSYARARVEVAQLYVEKGEKECARKELTELLADESHAAAFQKRQDRVWIKRAKTMLKQLE